MATLLVSLEGRKYNYEGPFIFQQIFDKIFEIAKNKKIDVQLKEYTEKLENGKKNISFNLDCSKKADDIHTYKFSISFEFNFDRIKQNNIDVDWGSINIACKNLVIDIKEETKENPKLIDIIKMVSDLITAKLKIEEHKNKIFEVCDDFVKEILKEAKAYYGLKRSLNMGDNKNNEPSEDSEKNS